MARLKIQGPSFSTATSGRVEQVVPTGVVREEGVDPRSPKGFFRNDLPFQGVRVQLIASFNDVNRGAAAAKNIGAYYMKVGQMGPAFIDFLDAAASMEDFELDFIMPEVDAMAEFYARRTAEPIEKSLDIIKGVIYEYLQNPQNEPALLHRALGGARFGAMLADHTQDAETAERERRETVREAEFQEQRIKKIHYARMAPEFEARRLIKKAKQQAWREAQGR